MSSTNVGSIHYDLNLDTSKFDHATENIRSKTASIGGSMASMGAKMSAAVTLPVVTGFGFAIKAASDFNETINKIDVAFKDQSASVKEWANTSIKKMGLAKGSALDAAALFGDMSTAMGLNTKEAAKMSTSLVQLGGDLASFKNVSFDRAQTALAGIYTGETEALKGLGIVMTEANLANFAQSKGIKKNIQDMTQAEKVQLRYSYVMSVTSNAQGDFSRTADGTANQMRIFNEKIKELSATLGQKLLPYVNKALTYFQKLVAKFESLSPKTQNITLVILGVVAVIGPLLIGLGLLVTAIGLLASPVTLVVLGIGALIGVITYLQIKFGILNPLLDVLKQTFYLLKPTIMDLINVFKTELLPQLQRLWDMVQPVVIPALKVLGYVLGVVLVVALYALINYIKLLVQAYATVIGWISTFIWWVRNAVVAVMDFGNAMWNAIKTVADKIGAFFSGAGHWLYDTGRAIIQGLINGVSNMAGALGDKVSSIANGVKDKFSSILKIRSPSKVFFGFGEDITKGLTDGISKSQATISKSVTGMTSMATQPVINPQINKGGNSSMSIYGNVNIGSKQDADYFFARANRQQDLLSMGLAPVGGV